MATAGSLVVEFVSQNAVTLVVAVLTTIVTIAISTYYVARNYMLSGTTIPTDPISNGEETASGVDALAGNEESASSKTSSSEEDVVIDAKAGGDGKEEEPSIDPVYYCEHIQGEIKKVKQDVTTRKICENLTLEDIEREKQRQRDQLEEIFKLMQNQEDRFGISTMDEMQDQMRLYTSF